MMSLWDALRMNMMISYQELVRTFPNVTDGDWLYFLDHYASENYRRYRYFSQVTACPAILLKISLLIW